MARRKTERPIKTQDEFVQVVGLFEDRLRELHAATLRHNARIAELKRQHEEATLALDNEVEELFARAHTFALTHQDELLPQPQKSVSVGTVEIGWRTAPRRVVIKRGIKPEEILRRIREAGYSGRFIRTTEELNKEALNADPQTAETIEGITIEQAEDFFMKLTDKPIERSRKEQVNKPKRTGTAPKVAKR